MGLDVDVVQVLTSVVDVSQVTLQQIEVTPNSIEVFEVLATDVIVVESPKTEVIEVEIKTTGPQGPPGAGENVPYAKRTDFVGADIIYKGEAAPGTTDSQALWRIKRIEFIGEDVKETWAGGTASFSNSWTDRTTLNYT